MKPRLAVIGSGVAGVVTAHYLQDQYDVTLLEKETRIGGHTHTVECATGPDVGLRVDTGFIVCNRKNYPGFFSFLANLGVQTQPSDMSFSYFSYVHDFCWGSDVPKGLFARRSHWFNWRYYRFVFEMIRFNWLAGRDYRRGNLNEAVTIQDWLAQHRFSDDFCRTYVVPMGAAIWSCAQQELLGFPALSFFRFWYNHGLLNLIHRPQWRTVKNGSNSYLEAFEAQFKGKIKVRQSIKGIQEDVSGVTVQFEDATDQHFDCVVVATHADTALNVLLRPSSDQKRLLGAWRYSRNTVVLHRDERVMPPIKSLWCSWSYVQSLYETDQDPLMVSYYMNRLQSLKTSNHYFVTLNPVFSLDHVVRELTYTHPIFDQKALATQSELPSLNESSRLMFAGSYFGYGFHEDAVQSALAVVARLKKSPVLVAC